LDAGYAFTSNNEEKIPGKSQQTLIKKNVSHAKVGRVRLKPERKGA